MKKQPEVTEQTKRILLPHFVIYTGSDPVKSIFVCKFLKVYFASYQATNDCCCC